MAVFLAHLRLSDHPSCSSVAPGSGVLTRSVNGHWVEQLDGDRQPGRPRQAGVRGQEGAAENLRQRHVCSVVCGEVGAPRPDPRQHRSVPMAPEVELVQPSDRRLGTVGGYPPRLHVAPKHVENLEVEELWPMQGNPRIEEAPADSRPDPRAENELGDHRCVKDDRHPGLSAVLSLPAIPRRTEDPGLSAATRQSARTPRHA